MPKRAWGLLVVASLVSATTAARADDASSDPTEPEQKLKMPIAYAQRGLTNPALTLTPGLGLDVSVIGSLGGLTNSSTLTNLVLSAGLSLTDDFALRTTLAPLELSPTVNYGTISLANPYGLLGPGGGATYRFARGEVEAGLSFDFAVSTISGLSGASFVPGLPFLIRAGKTVRLDTGINFPILYASGSGGVGPLSETLVSVRVPVQVAVNIVDPLFVGLRTGFQVTFNPPAGEPAGDTVAVPLGFVAGGTVSGTQGPIVDFVPFFVWPGLVNGTGGSSPIVGSGPSIDAKDFAFGLDVIAYVFL